MILLIVFTVLYGALLLNVRREWIEISAAPKKVSVSPSGLPPEVSVLIPCRNESENILCLLEDLNSQKDYFREILIVNDHSTDDTHEKVQIFKKENPELNLEILSLDQPRGKKAAVTQGVGAAVGEVILCTDADCRVDPDWVKNMRQPFNDTKLKMLAGPVYYREGNFVQLFQQLELSALISVGGAAFNKGKAIMINAANMAFRKSVFLEVEGYKDNDNIPSGDDEFLMRKVLTSYPSGSRYLLNHNNVYTAAPDNVKTMLNQKRRWASKWNKSGFSWTSTALFLYYFLLIYYFINSWFHPILVKSVLSVFLLKMLADYFLLKPVFRQGRIKMIPFMFVVSEILYPFYVLLMGILANFGNYTWKGRKHKIR